MLLLVQSLGFMDIPFSDSLRGLDAFYSLRRQLRGDLNDALKTIRGFANIYVEEFFKFQAFSCHRRRPLTINKNST